MNILITGSNGFIGKTLKQRKPEQVKVFDFDINTSPYKTVLNRHDVADAIDEAKPDIIYHLASPSSQVLFSMSPSKCMADAVLGTLNVLEMAHGIPVFIPSTSSLYGVANDYAKSKAIIEDMAKHYKNVLVRRIFAGYGPNEEHKGGYASIIYQWLKQIKDGVEIEVWGDGTQSRDFVYQDDIADRLLNIPPDIDIGSGVSTTFNDVLEIMREVIGREFPVKYTEKPTNYLESTKSQISICPTSLRYGIERTWESLNIIRSL